MRFRVYVFNVFGVLVEAARIAQLTAALRQSLLPLQRNTVDEPHNREEPPTMGQR